jgi:hypothetical protein
VVLGRKLPGWFRGGCRNGVRVGRYLSGSGVGAGVVLGDTVPTELRLTTPGLFTRSGRSPICTDI